MAAPNETVETPLLWLGRPSDQVAQGKNDGVMVVPYAKGMPVNEKPVCWYFGLDKSGSMSLHLPGKPLSRWDVALLLLTKLGQDLVAAKRSQDRFTLVTFNVTATEEANNVPIEELPTYLERLKTALPDGLTNIQVANSVLHTLMRTNPLLLQGSHRAAEIFFTDGDATAGLLEAADLRDQKKQLYQELMRTLPVPHVFLWCGAISDEANWRIVRGMSEASPLSLWAYIRSAEMSREFGEEIGGVLAVVTNLRTYALTPERTVMLLPDTDNAYYCLVQPATTDPPVTVTVSSLITLFKMRHLLEIYALKDNAFTSEDVKEWKERARACQKTDDPFVNLSVKWTTAFEALKASILKDLQRLETSGKLQYQVGAVRNLYQQSKLVRTSSANYTALV